MQESGRWRGAIHRMTTSVEPRVPSNVQGVAASVRWGCGLWLIRSRCAPWLTNAKDVTRLGLGPRPHRLSRCDRSSHHRCSDLDCPGFVSAILAAVTARLLTRSPRRSCGQVDRVHSTNDPICSPRHRRNFAPVISECRLRSIAPSHPRTGKPTDDRRQHFPARPQTRQHSIDGVATIAPRCSGSVSPMEPGGVQAAVSCGCVTRSFKLAG
jgi:hypothetical protein